MLSCTVLLKLAISLPEGNGIAHYIRIPYHNDMNILHHDVQQFYRAMTLSFVFHHEHTRAKVTWQVSEKTMKRHPNTSYVSLLSAGNRYEQTMQKGPISKIRGLNFLHEETGRTAFDMETRVFMRDKLCMCVNFCNPVWRLDCWKMK